ncbi:proteasome subunit beta type-6-like [Schistocerca gregaria]|uniref:proteasome subunit beta type-6-like n=1 Tax=Schistocerca gregaria TaxID=7010 RepID=UPI00211E3A88|nr:proteasome subunit beta type-6-like [Schistocerca gregaria]XP_049847830.1 proteasome subunit beta type-6-like [Schistocerca gregaria]
MRLSDKMCPEWMSTPHSMGTSIMAVEFDGGVIMGADSRTTTGAYIANRVSDKITNIAENIWVCRSGSSADTQAVASYVKWYLDMHSIEMNQPPLVKTAALLAQQICYNNKAYLVAGLIVGGWDSTYGGQVYQITLGGLLQREKFAIGGSGSTYIIGHCDKQYKDAMTKEECAQFVSEALTLAMLRDGSSGGIIRMVTITKDGSQRSTILGNELSMVC